jgi:hypothetical protein
MQSYVADRAATGLGCVEQCRYCAGELGYCTQWSPHVRGAEDLARCIRESLGQDSTMANEVEYLYASVAD